MVNETDKAIPSPLVLRRDLQPPYLNHLATVDLFISNYLALVRLAWNKVIKQSFHP